MQRGRHSLSGMPPHLSEQDISPKAIRMAFELLLVAQMIRKPAQALARRWYCRSLFRASRGRFHCAGCTKA
jgi:hypothetical protein